MAQEVELEEFRSQWRKELGPQNVTVPYRKGIPKKNVAPDPFDSDKQQASWCNVEGSRKINDHAASLLLQVTEDVTNVVYQPFVIVGQLLKEGSSPNTSAAKTKRTDLDRRTLDNRSRSSKRSYFDLGDETQEGEEKKKKTANRDEKKRRESFLDYLVADLDEINEIPFFEISLARELALKIFQHLDLKDLCRCAQVSKSWQSLSEDNWLWYNIYSQRQKTKALLMTEEHNWKSVVKEEHERCKTLLNNWKVRLGRVKSLLYVQAGVLSAAAFHKDTVVAGYTNGQVKLHNLANGDICVFQPSDMSLQLDNTCEEGTVANDITRVDTTDTLTVAVFKHGFVDIWWNDGDLKPCHTIHCGSKISTVSLAETHSDTLVTVATGPYVIFEAAKKKCREENGGDGDASIFKRLVKVDFSNKVSSMKFLPNAETSCAFDHKLAVATNHTVKIYTPPTNHGHIHRGSSSSSTNFNNNTSNITLTADSENSTEIHNMYGTPITCMEVSGGSQPKMAVGLGSSTGLFDGYQVKLYDLCSGKLSVTFHGHTWHISCMHLNSDNSAQPSKSSITLTTGCGDRKVRLYDARCSFPVMTLAGHTQRISSVQADKWKIVSGGEDGVVAVWDIRMATQLWDWHNRHPVRFCCYNDRYLVVANVPDEKFVDPDNDGFADRRHRGSLQVYDFFCDDQLVLAEALPDICRSSYDQLHGYDYGISLVTPYDTI